MLARAQPGSSGCPCGVARSPGTRGARCRSDPGRAQRRPRRTHRPPARPGANVARAPRALTKGPREFEYWSSGRRRVVLWVSLDRQAISLDRVREDHRRSRIVDSEKTSSKLRNHGRRDCGSHRREPDLRAGRSRARYRLPPSQPIAELGGAYRRRRWYSGFDISFMRWKSASTRSPEERLEQRAVLRREHLPPACGEHRLCLSVVIVGTTRSSDWRFASTIQTSSPRSATCWSITASQIAPSSSSASPTSEYGGHRTRRRSDHRTYRRARAPQIGAVAPIPTDPVE